MAQIIPLRPIIRSVSATVRDNHDGVFVVKTKVDKIVCCGLIRKRTAIMLLVTFLAFGLVAFVGVGFHIVGRL